MKLIWGLSLGLLALCGCAAQEAQWSSYSDTADEFSVQMPGVPQRESSTRQEAGGTVTSTSHSLDLGEGREYVVDVLTLPAPPSTVPQTLFDDALRETTSGDGTSGLEIVSRQPTTQQGRAALDVEMRSRTNGDPYFSRMTLSGRRLYTLVVTLPKDERDSGDAQKFLQSFQLTSPGTTSGSPQ